MIHVLTVTEPQISAEVTFKGRTNIKPFENQTKYLLAQKHRLDDKIIMGLTTEQLTCSTVLREVRHIIRCRLCERRRPSTERRREQNKKVAPQNVKQIPECVCVRACVIPAYLPAGAPSGCGGICAQEQTLSGEAAPHHSHSQVLKTSVSSSGALKTKQAESARKQLKHKNKLVHSPLLAVHREGNVSVLKLHIDLLRNHLVNLLYCFNRDYLIFCMFWKIKIKK